MRKKYEYDYPMVALTTDFVVFSFKNNQLKVLLIERSKDPFKGCLALPGGFVNHDEEVEDAAYRELQEETALKKEDVSYVEQTIEVAYTKVGRDPRGRTISIAYFGICDCPEKAKAGDDAKSLVWFPVDDITPKTLAFDHSDILRDALSDLAAKLQSRVLEPNSGWIEPSPFLRALGRAVATLDDKFLVSDILPDIVDKLNERRKGRLLSPDEVLRKIQED